jgi:hypothetical protein
MKKAIISKIILMAMAALLAGLYGCEKEKGDNSLLTLLAVLNQDLTVKKATPASGSTGVALDANIVIQFNRPTDGSSAGTVIAGSTTYTSGLPSVTGWSYNSDNTILTIARAAKFVTYTKYMNLYVSGFVDEDGNVMENYSDDDYAFTTLGPKVVSITPASGSTGVVMPVDVVITFDSDLDATVGTQRANLSCCSGGSFAFNISSSDSEIDISGSKVTVHTTDRLIADTKYSNLVLEYFKAADGGSIPTYTISSYNFTTE